MKKFKWYFDKDKEEEWLNGMCSKGWAMTKFFLGVYTFVPCEPQAYTYQIDMPVTAGKLGLWGEGKQEYLAFMEAVGAEHVCSWGFWTFFRKETAQGDFQMYTDAESRIWLYQRIRRLFLAVGLYDLSVSALDTYNFWNDAKSFLMAGGSLPDLDGCSIYIPVLVLMYLMTITMLMMAARVTLKIRRLKQEKIFP